MAATHPDLAAYFVLATVATGLLILVGQAIERRSRRQELILSEAVKLAQAETETRLRIAAAHNKPLTLIRPMIQTTGHCYEDLKHLMKGGKLEPVYIQIRKPKDR
jgi:hypothetical protein